MKALIIFMAIIVISQVNFAQNVRRTTFQRPEVSALTSEVQTPVSLSSGNIGIEIPLYTLVKGDISVPISLSYDASGVKVNTHPGWTGQNWTLKAGGMITRVVKSIPDETCVGWDMIFPFVSGENTIRNEYFWGVAYHFDKVRVNDWNTTNKITEWAMPGDDYSELENDEYIFNFCGQTGRFYVDHNGRAKTIGKEGYIIESIIINDLPLYDVRYPIQDPVTGEIIDYAISYRTRNYSQLVKLRESRIFGFKITDPQGFIYYFGAYEQAFDGINEDEFYEDDFKGVETTSDFFSQLFGEDYSTWHLVKIVSPLKNQVEFEYEKENSYASAAFSNNYSMSKMRVNDKASFWNLWSPGYMQLSSSGQSLDGNLIQPMYLKSIKTDDQTVVFKRSRSQALDYDYNFIQSYLHQIAREAYDPDILSVYYGIFLVANSAMIRNNNGQYVQSKIILPALLGWAKLNEIEVNWNTNNNIPLKFQFSYHENSADRLQLTSIQKKSGSESEPPYLFEYNNTRKLPGYLDLRTDHWGYYNGTMAPVSDKVNYINYREPNSNYTDSEILKRITYPTGGMKEFIYEPNKYTKVVKRDKSTGAISVASNSERSGGGLRIKEIIEKTDAASQSQRKTYTYSGGILNGEIQYYWPDYKGKLTNGNNYTAEKFYTSSMLPVSDNPAGGCVSYTKVTESIPGSGRTEYTFSNHDSHPDENAVSIDPQKSAYSPLSSRAMERGNLLKEEIYKELSVQPVKRTTYTYSTPRQDKYVRQVRVCNYTLFDGNSPNAIEGAAYKIYTDPALLQTKKEELFTDNSLTCFQTEISYKYNDIYLISEETKKESKPTSTSSITSKTINKYIYDAQIDYLDILLKKKNCLTFLTNVVDYKNDIKMLETKYSYYTGLPGIDRIFVTRGEQSSENGNTVYSVAITDSRGNPVVIVKNESSAEILIWSFNYRYLIAKVQNAFLDEVKEVLHQDPSLISAMTNPDMILINTLRQKLPEALVTTYTYDYRGNVTSVTNPNGQTTSYEYDLLNRLKATRDHKGNLVESYDYHYKN